MFVFDVLFADTCGFCSGVLFVWLWVYYCGCTWSSLLIVVCDLSDFFVLLYFVGVFAQLALTGCY